MALPLALALPVTYCAAVGLNIPLLLELVASCNRPATKSEVVVCIHRICRLKSQAFRVSLRMLNVHGGWTTIEPLLRMAGETTQMRNGDDW